MKAPAKAGAKVRQLAPADSVRTRLSAAQRREKFLDVAAELIAESGIDAVTMERVAERSGVSKALGYGYFENSDKLLAALFVRETAGLDKKVLAQIAGVDDAGERLNLIMGVVFEVVAERGPILGRLLQSRTSGGALERARQERQQFQETYFTKMIEQDGGVPARQAAIAAAIWLAAVNGVLELTLTQNIRSREIVGVFAKMIVGGTRALRADAESSAKR